MRNKFDIKCYYKSVDYIVDLIFSIRAVVFKTLYQCPSQNITFVTYLLYFSYFMGIVHFIPTLGLRDQIGKNQPRCVRKLSFSNAKDSDGLPFKRLKLDEDSTVVNTGD